MSSKKLMSEATDITDSELFFALVTHGLLPFRPSVF